MTLPIPALLDDDMFDQHFPFYVRSRSGEYWTPVAVAARVAAMFCEQGARKILDVGCGPGKFCIVAGCLHAELDVHGVEQRRGLVGLGNRLVRRFGVSNVRFEATDATQVPWSDYDGFYFFNPFAENTFDDHERFDNEAQFSAGRFWVELLRVQSLLAGARIGTVVVTYHGLGGPIPSSYDLVADEPAGSDRIRAWVQRSHRQADWAWLEDEDGVGRVLRGDLPSVLASLSAKPSP